jgi:hypothetical protein
MAAGDALDRNAARFGHPDQLDAFPAGAAYSSRAERRLFLREKALRLIDLKIYGARKVG